MTSIEDTVVNNIIKEYKIQWENKPENFVVSTEPEAHYNHYGTRGVADLYVMADYEADGQKIKHHIIEVKGKINNTNEVIRQFNKMRRYFFKDEDRQRMLTSYKDRVKYELALIPNEHNLREVKKNKEIYIDTHKSPKTRVGWRPAIEDNHSFAPITLSHSKIAQTLPTISMGFYGALHSE